MREGAIERFKTRSDSFTPTNLPEYFCAAARGKVYLFAHDGGGGGIPSATGTRKKWARVAKRVLLVL